MKRIQTRSLLILFVILGYSFFTDTNAGNENPGVRFENAYIEVTIKDRTGRDHIFKNPKFIIQAKAGSASVNLRVGSYKRMDINGSQASVVYWDKPGEILTIDPDQGLYINGRRLRLQDCRSIFVSDY
jgi:hypothetical protein